MNKTRTAKFTDRPSGASSAVSIPRRRVRYRSGIRQYRRMVAVDSGGGAAAQGPAVLSSVRGKRGDANTSPMCPSRTCCLTPRASRCGIRRSRRFSRQTIKGATGRAIPAELSGCSRSSATGRQNERGAPERASFASAQAALLLGLLAFQLLARLFSAALQIVLQLLLLFLEHFRIGRRPVIGLGEIA